MHSKPFAVILSIVLVSLTWSGVLNSQAPRVTNPNSQQAIMKRLQALEEQQALVLESQDKTLEALKTLKEAARQTKIFASRG